MPLHRSLLALALLSAHAVASAQLAYFPSTGAGDVVLPVTSIKQARLAGTLLRW